ncbi:MAG: O-antigen ligase family protein, partial [Patescibacteria group bacterium]
MPNLEKFLNSVVKYGLYAILLAPLIFWPRALYAFMTPKFILFQVLAEIVFAAWLLLIIYGDGWKQTIIDFRRNYVVLALSGFLAVSFISAFFGIDFGRSFWGIGARMTGLLAELHFFAWFLILISFFSVSTSDINKKNWYKYIDFSFWVSILVALSAFFQNTEWRIGYGSTFFNNPTFVAPYFLFHFFWGMYQVINLKPQTSNLKKWLFGSGAVLLAFVIFLGEVRGAILGLLIGLIILGLGLIFADAIKRHFKILLLAFFVAIFAGLVGVWFLRESAFVQNTSALKRLTQLSLGQTTFQTRFAAWRIAVQGSKEHSLLGVGPENFNYVFNAHYNPALLKYGFGETWFDKPHNAFLEILAEIGVVGGLAYLFILATAAFALFKLFKKGLPALPAQTGQSGQKILALILTGAFTAYLSSMFFSFDSFGSWFGLYLFLAFLSSNKNSEFRILNSESNSNDSILKHSVIKNLKFKILIMPVIFIGTLILLYLNYSIWRANVYDADALRIFSRDQVQGITYFKKSLNYFTPYKTEYQFDMVASVVGALAKNLPIPQLENNLNFVLDGADKAIKAHPKNAAYYTDMAKLYNILGEKGRNPEILNQAEMFGIKSLELSPNRQETMFYLARTALLKGDSRLAVKWSKQAEELGATLNLSRWYLGLAYIADNQIETGKIEIKKALELGYPPLNET